MPTRERSWVSDVQLAQSAIVIARGFATVEQARPHHPPTASSDTCAAEFEAYTPYYYSTYGDENERRESGKKKGHHPRRRAEPHRAGDRVRLLLRPRAFALRELGFETIMVNSNPETVSTDYDTSDKLYFEPLTLEDVLNICEQESENLFGVIVQFGGQTPLNLANGLAEAGVPDHRHLAEEHRDREDRKLFGACSTSSASARPAAAPRRPRRSRDGANSVAIPCRAPEFRDELRRGMMLVHNETDCANMCAPIDGCAGKANAPDPRRLISSEARDR
jgi:carbamoyl-phosphate synthase large subunit